MPEELIQLRRQNEQLVNEALLAQEDELVLVHWFDMEEHNEVAMSGGIKSKYPYEAECIAFGISTGHPATSFYRNVKYQHYVWALPVGKMWKLILSPDTKATSEHPQGKIYGSFLKLPRLFDNSRNQHGKAEFANFPWQEQTASPTNVGGSHLSLEVAEPMNYQPFTEGDERMRCERAAQVVVGHDAVTAWLKERIGNYLTNEQVDKLLIPDIYRLSGYDWTYQQAA